jgi:hypothetical protein
VCDNGKRRTGFAPAAAAKWPLEQGADENVRHIEALHRAGVIRDDERDATLRRVDGQSDVPNMLGES